MVQELTKKGRVAIARFLSSEAGEELKGYLAFNTPSIAVVPDAHIMHFTSGASQGWGQCVRELEKLSTLRGQDETIETEDSLGR